MNFKIYKIPPSYGHPPYQGGQGGSSAKRIVGLIVTSYLDSRYNYEEIRYIAVGYLERRLHILCFTETPNGIRVISFRKANAREAKRYEKSKIID